MPPRKIILKELAHARSGDKGADANIGVIAYTEEGYQLLKEALTAEIVQRYFQPLSPFTTVRYELPNLLAFNFVLKGILAGGGSRSLRIDSQGKALGEALLLLPLEI